MAMATLYPVSRVVKLLVEEKESRTRELLKIMGLRDWVYSTSWFITAFISFSTTALLTTLLLTSRYSISLRVSIHFILDILYVCKTKTNFFFPFNRLLNDKLLLL